MRLAALASAYQHMFSCRESTAYGMEHLTCHRYNKSLFRWKNITGEDDWRLLIPIWRFALKLERSSRALYFERGLRASLSHKVLPIFSKTMWWNISLMIRLFFSQISDQISLMLCSSAGLSLLSCFQPRSLPELRNVVDRDESYLCPPSSAVYLDPCKLSVHGK